MKTSSLLLQEMNERLQAITGLDQSNLDSIRSAIDVVAEMIIKLKSHLLSNTFTSEDEEIDFFKNIKPQFDGKMIFYLMLLRIHQYESMATIEDKRIGYQNELNRLKPFYEQHYSLWMYYSRSNTYMDRMYFLRPQQNETQFLQEDNMFHDYHTNAPMSSVVAKFHAYELFREHMTHLLRITENPPAIANNDKQSALTWTASKVASIELIYALQEYGAFNNSRTVDIKKIADYFSHAFNVNLGNVYKAYEDIRLRKKSPTPFLDVLKAALTNRIDRDNENAL